jgi:hypothetical protein
LGFRFRIGAPNTALFRRCTIPSAGVRLLPQISLRNLRKYAGFRTITISPQLSFDAITAGAHLSTA